MGLIKCPGCQSDVSPEADACPKCGHPVARSIKKKNTQLGCSVVVLAIIIWAIWGGVSSELSGNSQTVNSDANTGASPSVASAPRPVQTYTAQQLYAMFHANEIKATQTIGNAIVRFTGVLASIQKSDFSKTPELQIRADCFVPGDCQDPNAWNTIDADLRESQYSAAATLTKGEIVTLQCANVSMPVDVYARHCILVTAGASRAK